VIKSEKNRAFFFFFLICSNVGRGPRIWHI